MRYTTIYNDPKKRRNITESCVYWDNAFTDEDIDNIVKYCENFELTHGVTFSETDKEKLKDTRRSKISFHQRNNDNAWIFDRLNFVIQSANEMFYGFELNGYEAFQYTMYDESENGMYDWHMDMGLGTREFEGEPRKLSLTLCLNDDFEGGEFQINTGKENEPITPEVFKGRCLLFPSFVIHRVKPVTKGTRKSLVVWVEGPKFT